MNEYILKSPDGNATTVQADRISANKAGVLFLHRNTGKVRRGETEDVVADMVAPSQWASIALGVDRSSD